MLFKVARRLTYPRHVVALAKCARIPKQDRKSSHDAELKFCADVLPGDFLNYGYHEDPSLPPEKISLSHLQEAQLAYGRLLASLVVDKERPVLDAGCGMGGLLQLLVRQGLHPVALTPNRAQLQHVRASHPSIPLLEGKFNEETLKDYHRYFGTVITSESFQYMKLAPGLKTIQHVLAPGGRWVICDYFRISDTRRKSGHQWLDFKRAVDEHGFSITFERDITPHVLPTLRYLHMLGARVGGAAADFAIGKLKRKHPAFHYIMEEVVADWRGFIRDQVKTVDPDVFVTEKKYMLMVIERTSEEAPAGPARP